jgi:hypothetical protein
MSAVTERQDADAPSYMIQGRRVTLPCVVRDAGSASVIYMVPAAVAQEFVGPAYEAVEMAPGLTQLILGFVDYRDNDLGDYNEVMVVFTVRPKGAAPGSEGTYIYKLPVNQSFTCEAGCKIWGFPKSVEEIDIEYSADRVCGRLVMQGKEVFTLRVPRDPQATAATPEMAMTTYTYLEGPARLPFTTGGHGTTVTMGGDGVELSLGDHPLADELRQLGLPATPMMCTWMEHMYGTFGVPQPLEATR